MAAAAHARLAQSYAARRRLPTIAAQPSPPVRRERALPSRHVRHDGSGRPLHADRPILSNLASDRTHHTHTHAVLGLIMPHRVAR